LNRGGSLSGGSGFTGGDGDPISGFFCLEMPLRENGRVLLGAAAQVEGIVLQLLVQ